jgi:hypothetical protein
MRRRPNCGRSSERQGCGHQVEPDPVETVGLDRRKKPVCSRVEGRAIDMVLSRTAPRSSHAYRAHPFVSHLSFVLASRIVCHCMFEVRQALARER